MEKNVFGDFPVKLVLISSDFLDFLGKTFGNSSNRDSPLTLNLLKNC